MMCTLKRVRYDGEELMAFDEVGDALIQYALRLALTDTYDVISVPTLTPAGNAQTVELFLNSGIDLSSRPFGEPEGGRHNASAFVADLEIRSAEIDTASMAELIHLRPRRASTESGKG